MDTDNGMWKTWGRLEVGWGGAKREKIGDIRNTVNHKIKFKKRKIISNQQFQLLRLTCKKFKCTKLKRVRLNIH